MAMPPTPDPGMTTLRTAPQLAKRARIAALVVCGWRPETRGLHSSILRLNVSTFCGIRAVVAVFGIVSG